MVRQRLVSVLVWLLPGLAAAQAGELAQRTKVLCVQVATGHELQLLRIGFMVFGNKRASFPVAGGRGADLIHAEVAAQLEAERRYTLRRLEVVPDRLPELAARAQKAGPGVFGGSMQFLAPEIEATRASGCDALLLIESGDRGVRGTNQSASGLAWVASGNLGSDEVYRPAASALLAYRLIDPQTGDVAASELSRNEDGHLEHGLAIDAALWPAAMDGVSPAAWNALLPAFAQDIRNNIRMPLFRMGLRPSCTKRFERFIPRQRLNGPTEDTLRLATPMPEGADPAWCP